MISRKKLSFIGYQLLKRRPDIATEILTEYIATSKSQIEDTSLISWYFDAFCESISQSREDIVNIKNNYSFHERKREFVGLVIKIYHPAVFSSNADFFQPQRGMITNLSSTLNVNKGNVSRMLSEVLVRLRAYDDFKLSIENLYNKIF